MEQSTRRNKNVGIFFCIQEQLTKVTIVIIVRRMFLKLVTGNGEWGTGVWERVNSGNPPEKSKWRGKQRLQTLILLLCRCSQCINTVNHIFAFI